MMIGNMKNIILGTDWWSDCDDVVALRIISRFVRAGKVNLLGIALNACMEYSVASLRGALKAEKMEEIPIGIDLQAVDYGGKTPYQKRLAETFCPEATNADAVDAVRLYRQILAAAEAPVDIIEIGFLQVISAVLESGGDDISEKSGLELVKEKVSKIWVMAGKWDKDGEKENNFCRTERSRVGGAAFCRCCPVPVTFLGWEIGIDVLTGGELDHDDYLHQVLVDHGSGNGRCSWDPMLALMAIVGDEKAAGYDTVSGFARVDVATGANFFTADSNGPHKYVIKKFENDYYKKAINRIIR